MAIIKRSREDYDMANYLIMLSSRPGQAAGSTTGRVFECKTCNRRFPSFQALGGHRASHKKPRTMVVDDQVGQNQGKPKAHECSICGLEFAVGQALGGHMRRHRAALTGSHPRPNPHGHFLTSALSLSLAVGSNKLGQEEEEEKKGEGDDKKRDIKCLDLNLTPLENGLLEIGMVPPLF